MMKLRWTGDDHILRGATALDCLRYHCHGDHSAAARSGDVDGVMKRIAEIFRLDQSYAALSTLEARCDAFVNSALACGLLVDLTALAIKTSEEP